MIWVSAAAGSAGIWGNGLPYANRAVRIAREKSLAATLPHALQAQASQLVGRSQFDLGYASAEEGYQLAFDLGLPWARDVFLPIAAETRDALLARPFNRLPSTGHHMTTQVDWAWRRLLDAVTAVQGEAWAEDVNAVEGVARPGVITA